MLKRLGSRTLVVGTIRRALDAGTLAGLVAQARALADELRRIVG